MIPHLEQFFGKQGIDFTCYVGHQIDYEKFDTYFGTKNIDYILKSNKMDVIFYHISRWIYVYDDCHYGHSGDSPKHIAFLSQWGYT